MSGNDSAAVGPWLSSARIPFAAESLPPVRHQVLADLSSHHIPDEAGYDVALVLAELVGNALKHARPLGDGALHLEWGYWDDNLHVHVTDGGAATEPEVRVAGPTATSGRGLSIVEAVSSAWGVCHKPHAKTVWALISAPAGLVGTG